MLRVWAFNANNVHSSNKDCDNKLPRIVRAISSCRASVAVILELRGNSRWHEATLRVLAEKHGLCAVVSPSMGLARSLCHRPKRSSSRAAKARDLAKRKELTKWAVESMRRYDFVRNVEHQVPARAVEECVAVVYDPHVIEYLSCTPFDLNIALGAALGGRAHTYPKFSRAPVLFRFKLRTTNEIVNVLACHLTPGPLAATLVRDVAPGVASTLDSSPSRCKELQWFNAHQELRCVDVHCVRDFVLLLNLCCSDMTGFCYRVHYKSFIPSLEHNSSTLWWWGT